MDIFPKIAKTILIMIIGIIIYSFLNDFGRMYVAESQNSYIARNSSSYTSKFTVDEKELADYKEYSITSEDASKTLKEYFDLQYKNLGYTLKSSNGTNNKMKLVYVPKDRKIEGEEEEYENYGPIYVRIITEGFDGTSNRLGENGVGLVIINIEQKVPSSLRNMLKTMGTTTEVTDDYEGFWGYYSVVQDYAFTMNVLKKAF